MLNRRDALLSLGRYGLGAMTLPTLLRAEGAAAATTRIAGNPRAKSCILIFLVGGPPTQDMFDMKPNAPDGIRTLYKPINTNVDGIQVCEHLPQIARQAKRMAIVRSMTHPSEEHWQSTYHVLTGRGSVDLSRGNHRLRSHFPCPGAVVSRFSPAGSVPASVSMPGPIFQRNTRYAGTYAGFLGPLHDPLEVPETPIGLGTPQLDADLPAGLSTPRLSRRRDLLQELEALDRAAQEDPISRARDSFMERAFSLLTGPATRGAFNLDQETAATRDRYGRNLYGECVLMARRLVEAGVRLVTVNWHFLRSDNYPQHVWDNHSGIPATGTKTGYELLTGWYCFPSLDKAYSALLDDLAQRGLLDETLVVMTGEFGRTPKINQDMGRDHWGHCYSTVLAGGGVRGGQAYGASDADAAYPADNPVRPEDLLATVYQTMGIPWNAEVPDLEGRPQPICSGEPVRALLI
jgi:hypothetical protein